VNLGARAPLLPQRRTAPAYMSSVHHIQAYNRILFSGRFLMLNGFLLNYFSLVRNAVWDIIIINMNIVHEVHKTHS